MRTIVINTGTELLLGEVLNTHLTFLARELFTLGLRIDRQITVPDGPAIRSALAETFGHADLVFVTGGLGPTTDDITRDAAAELLRLELRHDPDVMAIVTSRFSKFRVAVTQRVARQAGGLKLINRQYKAYRMAQIAKAEKALPYAKFIERFTAGLVRDVAMTGRMI